MDNNKRDHIRKIRDDFQASQRVRDSLNHSIQALAEDLYSKETHFIFELIQNAEDNTYMEFEPSLCFRLVKTDPTFTRGSDGALIIQNNEIGFSSENVDAICAVGKTTKSKIQGYIGEKGIGFKSVFRVTTTPYIFSNDYRFCLPEHDEETGLGYIVPRWVDVPPEEVDLLQTTIILPLDKAGYSYTHIEEMLRDIDPETILFLSKLKEIQILTDTGDAITILKDDSKVPKVHILVEGEKEGKFFSEVNEFQLYTQPFDKPGDIIHEKRNGIDERTVSIAFPLDEGKKGSGKIFAYLPVRFDTGLPFLINADFILTSSREDIQRKVPWNRWLMDCVANLVADALPRLKESKLLTVMLLENLTSSLRDLDENNIFYPIVKAVRDALKEQELLPDDNGTFVSAINAKLASAEWLRKLLKEKHLRVLYKTDQPLKWLSGDITERGKSNLWNFIREQLKVEEVTPDSFARKIDETFLSNRSDDWMILFYKNISTIPALWKKGDGHWNSPGPLRNRGIIKLQDGSFVKPFNDDNSPNAYLSNEMDAETSLPIVKIEISKEDKVLQFLKDLGIPEVDIVEEVIERVLPKYTPGLPIVSIDDHENDIVKIERAYLTDSQEKKRRLKEKLQTTAFIRAYNPTLKESAYRQPSQIFFLNAILQLYFSGNPAIWFVSDEYDDPKKELFRELGVADKIKILRRESNDQGHVIIKSQHGDHSRGLDGFDPDITVDGLEFALFHPTPERSSFIWNKIAIPHLDCIRGIVEKSSRQNYVGSKKEPRESQKFGHLLKGIPWLPGPDGEFNCPSDLFLYDLPNSFDRVEKLADQLGMKKSIDIKIAEQFGVQVEDIDFLKRYPKEFQEWKAAIQAAKQKPLFPTRNVTDSGHREERLGEQVADSPKKEYDHRDKSVRTTMGTIDPVSWLRNNYTNDADQMICQVCKNEMPFRKRDGKYYFEKVEALSIDYFPREHEAQFLALCPLCAAMYNEFIRNDVSAMESLKKELMTSEEPEIPIKLGELDTSIRFVETHYHDIKTILRTQED